MDEPTTLAQNAVSSITALAGDQQTVLIAVFGITIAIYAARQIKRALFGA